MPETSTRSQNIKPSASMAIAGRVIELKNQGKKIINLAIGEPDFDTPEHIKEAAVKAIRDGFTKYTPVDGIRPLKEAICEKFQRENSLKYEPDEVLVSCGAKHSIYNLCQAVINSGDEVIVPAPYWLSYPEIVKLADGEPIFLETSLANKFKIKPEQLESHITQRTKVLLLNSPSNPTGMVYSKEELSSLADILLRYPRVLIVSDDIYEHIIWNHTPFVNILNVCPELRERTVIVNGVSKTYAMTGWRIGYAGGNNKIISAMKKIQSQSISCPASMAQAAANAALIGDQTCVAEMRKAYKERHDFLAENLSKISLLKLIPADGAFYLFIDISEAMQKTNCDTDLQFAELLLERTGISVLPGSAFGLAEHIRVSYATDMNDIREAVTKIGEILQ